MSKESWRLLDKVIALLSAMIAGVIVHYLCRALGLEVTTPGVIVGTAIAAISLSTIRWNFE